MSKLSTGQVQKKISYVMSAIWILSSIIYGVIIWYAIPSKDLRVTQLIVGVVINTIIWFLLIIHNLNRMSFFLSFQLVNNRLRPKKFLIILMIILFLILFFFTIGAYSLIDHQLYTVSLGVHWWHAIIFCIWYLILNAINLYGIIKFDATQGNRKLYNKDMTETGDE